MLLLVVCQPYIKRNNSVYRIVGIPIMRECDIGTTRTLKAYVDLFRNKLATFDSHLNVQIMKNILELCLAAPYHPAT